MYMQVNVMKYIMTSSNHQFIRQNQLGIVLQRQKMIKISANSKSYLTKNNIYLSIEIACKDRANRHNHKHLIAFSDLQ